MFSDLWPGFDESDVPIGSITNGVHAPTWTARELVEMGTQTSSQGDPADVGRPRALRRRRPHPDRRPLEHPPHAARRGWSRRCAAGSARPRSPAAPPRPRSAGPTTAFDPDVLTIGFARRVPSYKRLTLMLRDPERLKALLLDPERPIQLVIAGKSHPADDGGKQLIQEMVAFADDPEVRHRIAFLPGYDIGMARYLYWGCDVWLNNPLRPLEACGTSGMKAALNGGLNLSIRDGWWDEWFDGQNGWAIPTADGVADADRRDEVEARAIYDLLEHPGRSPLLRARRRRRARPRWVEMVRHTLRETGPKVLATRMVRDYVRRCTCRPRGSSREMARADFAPARSEAAWRDQLLGNWNSVRVAHVEATGAGDTPEIGSTLDLRAEVELPGLTPNDVQVQAAYGRVDDTDVLHGVQTVPMKHEQADGSRHWFTVTLPLERTGAFGYTVRVLPYSEHLATPAELGVVTTA